MLACTNEGAMPNQIVTLDPRRNTAPSSGCCCCAMPEPINIGFNPSCAQISEACRTVLPVSRGTAMPCPSAISIAGGEDGVADFEAVAGGSARGKGLGGPAGDSSSSAESKEESTCVGLKSETSSSDAAAALSSAKRAATLRGRQEYRAAHCDRPAPARQCV